MPDKLAKQDAPARKKADKWEVQSLLKLKERERAKFQSVSLYEAILPAIASGSTLTAIAKEHGLNLATVSIGLSTLTGDDAKAYQQARKASAAINAAMAYDELQGVDSSISGEVSLAIERSRYRMKVASIHDGAAFNERMQIAQATQQQASPASLPSFTLTILTGQQVKVEQDVIDVTPENANP